MTTAAASPRTDGPKGRVQSGPPLLAPVAAFAVLTIGYVVTNRATPHPDASGLDVLGFTRGHAGAVTVGAFLLFASSVPLAITAAVVYRRLRALGITAPGSAIALVGGILAAGSLALGAMFGWSGGRLAADASPALARALADLSFVSAGTGYAVAFGLLIAGIAVPSLLAGLLPRAVTWSGLVLGVAGALSSLTLLSLSFAFLLPVVRFGGLIWLVSVAVLLPRTRHGNR